jgi:hypothetical protein
VALSPHISLIFKIFIVKNILKAASVMMLSCALIFSLNSCKKDEDEGKLPNIAFKTGSDYKSADGVVAKSTAVKVGISASKAEDKDVLTKFTITRNLDGGADSVVYTKDLSGAEGDNYSYDYSTTTRNQNGTEKYTFTVVNRDGLINKVSITLTVQ